MLRVNSTWQTMAFAYTKLITQDFSNLMTGRSPLRCDTSLESGILLKWLTK